MANNDRAVAEAAWANQKHGHSTYVDGSTLHLSGHVVVQAYYDGDRLHYSDKVPAMINPANAVDDVWAITFIHDYQGGSCVPMVFDASGRIQKTARKVDSPLIDLHINGAVGPMPEGSFCVAPRPELEKSYAYGFSLEHYYYQYLLPFLFQQSYFEKNKDWPWPNYPHGPFGEYISKLEQRI